MTNDLITETQKVWYKFDRTLGGHCWKEKIWLISCVAETIRSYCAAESIESVANPRALDDFILVFLTSHRQRVYNAIFTAKIFLNVI